MLKEIDTDQYAMKGTGERFIHLVTFEYQTGLGSIRTFLYFHDRLMTLRYCEELVGGTLYKIEDPMLFEEISQWLALKKYDQIIITSSLDYLIKNPK